MLPAEAQKKQLEIEKQFSGEKRLKIAFGLNDLTRKLMEAGIKNQFPGISAREIKKQSAFRIGK